jgi:hypothetical protein
MFSFEPQKKDHKLYHLKWDAGFFNGQGQSGTTDLIVTKILSAG